jgi:MFS family permease
LFSFLSIQMQFLLRGILAWELTEREGALGLVYLSFGIALLIATPLGGVASDRFSKRSIIMISQIAITTFAVAMGLAVLFDVASFWMLLVSAMVQGTAFGFFGPARVAFSADLVGREQLGNAIALSLLSMNGTRIFAPSLAGMLAGWALFGIGGAYLMAGVFSLVALAYLLRLPNVAPIKAAGKQLNPLSEIADGVRHVWSRPPLRRLVLTSFFIVMFGFNYVAFYPAMVEGQFGLDERWVGYISSASALGAVAVAIPLASRANSSWAKPAMIVGGILFGLGVIGFGLAPNFWVAFAVIAFVGSANTIYQTLSNTMALNLADESHQGRVQSLMQLSFAGFGIAAAPLGLLAEVTSLRLAIVFMGVVTLITAMIYLIGEGGVVTVRHEAEALDAADRNLVPV